MSPRLGSATLALLFLVVLLAAVLGIGESAGWALESFKHEVESPPLWPPSELPYVVKHFLVFNPILIITFYLTKLVKRSLEPRIITYILAPDPFVSPLFPIF